MKTDLPIRKRISQTVDPDLGKVSVPLGGTFLSKNLFQSPKSDRVIR